MDQVVERSLEVFPWNTSFLTGIGPIDQQHQRLVELLNQVAFHLVSNEGSTSIEQVLDELEDYAAYHFSTEENIWSEYLSGDDWLTHHKHSHESFIEKIKELRQKEDISPNGELYDETLRFLIHWLAHHILDNDMHMAKVVAALGEGLSIQSAKERARQEMSGAMRIFIDTLLKMYGNLSSRTLDLMRERLRRSEVEDALRQSELSERAFSDSVMNSIPGLLYLYDESFRLIRWNALFNKLGYTDDELKNKPLFEFFAEDKHAKLKSALSELTAGNQIELEEEVRTREGKSAYYHFTGVPISLDGARRYLGVGINITDRRHAELDLERKSKEARDALIGTVTAVSRAMEARDPYTAGHQHRVAEISVAIARKLGWDEHRILGLQLGASVHDIGKLSIPVEMLVKPTRLSQVEYNVIQTHAESGTNILEGVDFPWPILEMIGQHHERIDGSGYPKGLTGDQICPEAKIIAVVDVFEAMSAHRPYRAALGVVPAIEELKAHRGTKYDTQIVDTLLAILEENSKEFDL